MCGGDNEMRCGSAGCGGRRVKSEVVWRGGVSGAGCGEGRFVGNTGQTGLGRGKDVSCLELDRRSDGTIVFLEHGLTRMWSDRDMV